MTSRTAWSWLMVASVVVVTGCSRGDSTASTSVQQTAALADGKVTADEYQASYDAVVTCLVGFGHTTTQEAEIETGLLSIVIESPDEASSLKADEDYRECYTTHASDVAVLWAQQQAGDADPTLAYSETLRCLERSLDLDLADVDAASPAELSAVIELVGDDAYRDCFDLATMGDSADAKTPLQNG